MSQNPLKLKAGRPKASEPLSALSTLAVVWLGQMPLCVSSKGFPSLQGSHLSQPLPWKFARQKILFIVQILLNCLSKSVNKIRNISAFGLFSLYYEKTQELSFLSPFALFLYADMPHPTGPTRLIIHPLGHLPRIP